MINIRVYVCGDHSAMPETADDSDKVRPWVWEMALTGVRAEDCHSVTSRVMTSGAALLIQGEVLRRVSVNLRSYFTRVRNEHTLWTCFTAVKYICFYILYNKKPH